MTYSDLDEDDAYEAQTNEIKDDNIVQKSRRIFSNDDYDIQVFEEDPAVLHTALKHARTWSLFFDKCVVAQHTKQAFREARAFVNEFYQLSQNSSSSINSGSNRDAHRDIKSVDKTKYVIIDSGCGVGLSSVKIAKLNPDTPVIGLDRSFVRLSKSSKNVHNSENMDAFETPPNLLLLRAEISDFLLLILRERVDWVIRAHYLLYPNPYPKPKHLQRRWHGTSINVLPL